MLVALFGCSAYSELCHCKSFPYSLPDFRLQSPAAQHWRSTTSDRNWTINHCDRIAGQNTNSEPHTTPSETFETAIHPGQRLANCSAENQSSHRGSFD